MPPVGRYGLSIIYLKFYATSQKIGALNSGKRYAMQDNGAKKQGNHTTSLIVVRYIL